MPEASDNAIKNLRSKIKSIRFGMLTTLNEDQSLSSRPMTQQQLDDNGVLWFFLSDASHLARDIKQYPHINVSFAEPADSVYVTISGYADVIKDREKSEELWAQRSPRGFPRG